MSKVEGVSELQDDVPEYENLRKLSERNQEENEKIIGLE